MKLKTMLSWISNIVTTVLIILLLLAVFIVISSRAAGGEPSLFGYQFKTVLSGSMEPEMQTGSVILIEQAENTAEFNKGDVITFKTKENLLITHRIIEVQNKGQSYITQGDNNNGPDVEPVLAQNIVGKYSGFTIPYAGYALHYLNTGQGAVLFLIIPGFIFLGYSAITIWRALRLIEVPKEAN
ncbi:signal peptidase I SipW [Bacillus sp. FJAT-50079]|uniref:signal peptidase I SipW n=1 Tax=Bacillus sp. FJAT-50079 TaxID=2833577 RepID=UPI001BC8D43A|nr:signal peptidase I [Bacillus sp. FJAT-50079]MBS4208688.1 signal peptidase I [Bacillus sp. FJAT-50079]